MAACLRTLVLGLLLLASPSWADLRTLAEDTPGLSFRTSSGFQLDAAGRPAGRPGTIESRAHSVRTAAGLDGAGGRWNELGPPVRLYPVIVADDARHRLILFGGARMPDLNGIPYTSDVWTLDTSRPSSWQRLEVSGVAPPGRAGHACVYDPLRNRLIVFGGFAFEVLPDQTLDFHYFGDTWALALDGEPHWSLLADSGPGERTMPACAYDPAHDRLVLAGGFYYDAANQDPYNDGEYKEDVWSLPLGGGGTWSDVTPAQPGPGPRSFALLAYDAPSNGFVAFGGDHVGGIHGVESLTDVWKLSLEGNAAWNPVPPGNDPPTPREESTTAWDATRRQVILLGGWGSDEYHSYFLQDRWTFDLATATWRMDFAEPTNRQYAAAVVDPGTDALYLGFGTAGLVGYADTWRLELANPTWSRLDPPGAPQFAASASAAFDPEGRRVVLFGGETTAFYSDPEGGSSYLGDVRAWNVDQDSWSPLEVQGPGPSPRTRAPSAFDSKRRRMWVIGGEHDYTAFQEAWALELAGTPRWWKAPDGPHPGLRYGLPTAVYDSIDDRVLYFGGTTGPDHDEIWALSADGVWSRLEVDAALPYRLSANAVFDPKRHRVLVFGDDLWALELDGTPAWHALAAEGASPLPRDYARAVYDPRHDRVLVFGGGTAGSGDIVDRDVYELALDGTPRWGRLAPTGDLPQARREHVLAFDPGKDRMLVASGVGAAVGHVDGWALQFERPTLEIALDLRPGVDNQGLSSRARGPVPVALLSAANFDPADVDVNSLALDGAPGVPSRKPARDWNSDGVVDLVVDFEGQSMTHAGRVLTLTGSLGDGTAIHGTADVAWHPPAELHGTPAAPTRLAFRFDLRGGSVELSVPAAGAWRLELYDVRGRRILDRSGLAAGPGTFPVNFGFAGPSGIYFARLRQGQAVAQGRLAWMR